MAEHTFIARLFEQYQRCGGSIDRARICDLADALFAFLFQLEDRTYADADSIRIRMDELEMELYAILHEYLPDTRQAQTITEAFMHKLPAVHACLSDDARAIADNDPAAVSLREVMIAYPGFYAIGIYRMAHIMLQQGLRILPRLWTEHAHSKTGIDIHPGARIGQRFFIDHGTGIVIGESCIIGDDVKIYQGVTLGALSVSRAEANRQRHPIIDDRVVIYSNATILGGDTRVGHDSIIGGNVWLTHSVAPHSSVFHQAQIKVREQQDKH